MKRICNFFKEKYKGILLITLSLLILITTQYILPVNLAGRVLNIYYSEIVMIVLLFIAFFDIIFHKRKININWKFLIIIIIFIVWFLGLTVYRYIVFHDITGGFIIFRVLLFPLLLFLLLKQYNIDKKLIIISLILFMFMVNIYQIYDLIFINNSFRGLGALKNINIYLCFAISLIPTMLILFKNIENEGYSFSLMCIFKTIIFFNLLFTILFSLLSGSRIGLIMCPLVSVLSYFLINKFNKKSIIYFILYVLTISAIIFFVTNYNIFDSTKNIGRATESINDIVNKDNKNDKDKNDKDKNESNETEEENEKDLNRDEKEIKQDIDNSVVDSNNMRNIIWDSAIKSLLENPIVGKVSNDIEFEFSYSNSLEPVKMIQSPHNFILEMGLAFGIPGTIIYLLIIGIVSLKVLVSKINITSKFNYILSMFVIFGFSFFQPLVTSYFVISLALWFVIYSYLKEE